MCLWLHQITARGATEAEARSSRGSWWCLPDYRKYVNTYLLHRFFRSYRFWWTLLFCIWCKHNYSHYLQRHLAIYTSAFYPIDQMRFPIFFILHLRHNIGQNGNLSIHKIQYKAFMFAVKISSTKSYWTRKIFRVCDFQYMRNAWMQHVSDWLELLHVSTMLRRKWTRVYFHGGVGTQLTWPLDRGPFYQESSFVLICAHCLVCGSLTFSNREHTMHESCLTSTLL